jgi:hypothetical protein
MLFWFFALAQTYDAGFFGIGFAGRLRSGVQQLFSGVGRFALGSGSFR